MNIKDTKKSLASQMAFGEDSDSLKKLGLTKRVVDFAASASIGILVVAAICYLFYDPSLGLNLIKMGIGVFIFLQIIEQLISYFQRGERNKLKNSKPKKIEQFQLNGTAKLLDEKPFEPATSVVENPTEFLPVEYKTRKFE